MCTPITLPSFLATRTICVHSRGRSGKPLSQCLYVHGVSALISRQTQPCRSVRSYAASTHAMHASLVLR